MLISTKLSQKMNQQIGNELGASNQYLSIAAYFDGESLPELAGFFYLQADEEREHALKFLHYLIELAELWRSLQWLSLNQRSHPLSMHFRCRWNGSLKLPRRLMN